MSKRVLITDRLSANHYIAVGWSNAFNSIGYQSALWDTKVPAFDVFNKFNPDLFICSSWQLDRAQVKCISQRPDMKVLISLSNWGNADSSLNPEHTHVASEDERRIVSELVQKAPWVKLGFCQYADKYVGETHNHWRNVGIEPFGLLLGADTVAFPLVAPDPPYKSDLFIVSGYWPQKGINLQQYITSLTYPNTNLNIKIFGNGWGIPQALGYAPDELLPYYYASAVVSPNIHEPQALRSGVDINQRAYQIFSCGGFQISQRVRSMEEDIFTNNEVVFVDTPKEFFERVIHFRDNPADRTPYIERGVDTVYKSHTFLHRVGEMLGRLGEHKDESKAYVLAGDIYRKAKEVFQEIYQ
jgi:hypothetical protein